MNFQIIQNLLQPRTIDQGFSFEERKRSLLKIENFYVPIMLFAIMRLLNFPNSVIYVLVFIVYLYVGGRYMKNAEDKLSFLNGIIYNDEIEPYGIVSYLEKDDKLVEFFYKYREYIDYNLTAYRETIENTNLLLQLALKLHGVIDNQGHKMSNIHAFYKRAMNSWHSLIHTLPSNTGVNNKFNDSLVELRDLLFKHVDMAVKILRKNKLANGIDNETTINPLDLVSDLKDGDYDEKFSFF